MKTALHTSVTPELRALRAPRGMRALLLACFLLAACTSPAMRSDPAGDLPDRSFDEAGNRVPTVATLHSLARVLAARGNDPQCEVVLLHLISLHPSYTPAYNELAELRLRRNRPGEALMALEGGLAVAPQDRVLLNNRGMLHVLLGDYEQAVLAFDQALTVWPDEVLFRSNRALALGMLGREEEALAAYLDVVSPSRAHHNLAVISLALGDEDGAESHQALADQVGAAQ